MFKRATRLRWRRKIRSRKKQVASAGTQADEGLDKHFFKRLHKVENVRRFVFSWVLLMSLLVAVMVAQINALPNYYQDFSAVPGGIFTEGILGNYTNVSPIYANSSVDRSVSKLVFAGLFKFDQNNKLVGDLSEGYKLDKSAKVYTVTLKDGLTWA